VVEDVVEVVDEVGIVVMDDGVGVGVCWICSLVHPKLITINTNRPIMHSLSFTTRTSRLVMCLIYLENQMLI
jgi:hypothetical protein